MTDTTHDLALARAERDAWQTTCEELHHQIARLTVEAETYRNDIDAADQRAHTLDAALAHEREAGRGLVAQVEEYRDAHGAKCDELAKLRAEVAELRARPEVPAEHGPITLPSPDAAQELADTYIDEFHRKPGHHKTFDHAVTMERRAAMRRALAKLSPAPAREAAPTLVAVSDEELMHEFYTGAENGTRPVNGIRAVRAKLDAAPKVCAIHSYEHGPGPCMTCGAWPPGTRELIAACQTRIAGLEQAADERSAEVARLTARVAELEARPVFAGVSEGDLCVQMLMAADPSIDPGIALVMVNGVHRAKVRAVLARLEVSLVAPEFLRRIPLYTKHGPGGKGDPGICDAACVKCEAERIIARLTAGVPVTPERK